jgi:hypothetical protein
LPEISEGAVIFTSFKEKILPNNFSSRIIELAEIKLSSTLIIVV